MLIRRGIRKDCSGAVGVEVALVIPLMVAILFGTADLANIVWGYHTANKAVRDATRYLARVPAGAVDTWGLTNATNLLKAGTIDGSSCCLASIWSTPSNITVSLEGDLAGDPFKVIRLKADIVQPITLLQFFGVSSSISYTVRHEQRQITE